MLSATVDKPLGYLHAVDSLRAVYDKACGFDSGKYGVFMPDAEKLYPHSRKEIMAKKYIAEGIKDTFGLSLDEFLSRPAPEVEMLLRLAAEQSKKIQKIITEQTP